MKKTGILVVNLGTPQSTEPKDVKAYLKEFLMDPYVIDIPKVSRYILVNWIITPFRSKKTSRAYKKVWTSEGSPLLTKSQKVTSKLNDITEQPVVLGMRYGQPSIADALKELYAQNIEEIIILPMYPQYASSSTQTALDEVKNSHTKKEIELIYLKPFYKDQGFIKNIAKNIKPAWDSGKYDHLLLSYHGLPEKHILKLDPACEECIKKPVCERRQSEGCYRSQAFQTSDLVQKQLGLDDSQISTTFQSRLGRDPWIKPYTDIYIEELVKRGIRNLLVATPSFTVDCLETLEEVAIELKKNFLEMGGESFHFIACLNDSDEWVDTVKQWVETRPTDLFKSL